MKSKVKNLTQPFVYGNFEINQKGSALPWIKGGSAHEIFYGLREDVGKLFLSSYVCDVANELSGEGVDNSVMLRLTLNTLYAIMNDLRPLPQIKAVFELRAAGSSGYMPDLSGCAFCKKECGEGLYLDVMNGCIICSECMMKRASKAVRHPLDESEERSVLLPINESVLAAMRYAIYAPGERMLSFKLNGEEENAMFSRAAEEYLLNHLERGFSSLEFYKSLLSLKA